MAFSSSATVARSAVADINITPLVDVLLVLLVIFMLSIPIIERPFDLSLQPSIDPKPASIEPLELCARTARGQTQTAASRGHSPQSAWKAGVMTC